METMEQIFDNVLTKSVKLIILGTVLGELPLPSPNTHIPIDFISEIVQLSF